MTAVRHGDALAVPLREIDPTTNENPEFAPLLDAVGDRIWPMPWSPWTP